jgi:TatD DNase family protein
MAILESWIAGLRATNHALAHRPGVLHSFSGLLETALRAIGLGFYVGVTGPVTYKKAAGRRHAIAGLPLESLLIETDSPYLAPEPYRGHRNEPAFVVRIADKIAEIHSRALPEIAAVTNENAARLFAWGETG